VKASKQTSKLDGKRTEMLRRVVSPCFHGSGTGNLAWSKFQISNLNMSVGCWGFSFFFGQCVCLTEPCTSLSSPVWVATVCSLINVSLACNASQAIDLVILL